MFRELLRALRSGQTKRSCHEELEEMVIQGRELAQFVADFIWYLRNLLVLKTADDAEELCWICRRTTLKQLQGGGELMAG